MIPSLKKFISNKEYRIIASNSIYLALIKGATYLVPLIIIPYLLKVVGVENYGRYVLAYSVIMYLMIIVDYGFQFTGTRNVAITKNINDLSKLFSSIFYARLLLAFFSSFILIIIGLIIKVDLSLYIYGCGVLIGKALLPVWLFQGKEKMQYITIVAIIPKIVTVILVLIFVKSKSDYVYLTLFDSIGFLISGVVGFMFAFLLFKVKLGKINLNDIKYQLKDGWQVFLSTVMISFYRQANVIILSIVGNYTVVGYYSVAEKIIKAIQTISTPVTQAIFPYFSRKFNSNEEKQKFVTQFLNWGRYFAIGFVLLAIGMMISSNFIVKLYIGDGFEKVSVNLMILSPVIVVGFLNYYYGIIGFINMGYQKYFNKAIVIASLFNITACFVLGYLLQDNGASISLLLAEIILFVIITYYFRKLESIKII